MQKERDGNIERDNGYRGNFAKSRNFRGGGAEAGPRASKMAFLAQIAVSRSRVATLKRPIALTAL